MRILVTGATGFIGRSFCSQMKGKYDLVTLVRNRDNFQRSGIECFEYDGTFESICLALDKVDVVLHLATHYVAEHKPENISDLINANISFGTLLLEAMDKKRVRNLVNIGTTWQRYNGIKDNYANLYAATKECFQHIAEWYADVKGLSLVNLHLNDTYGPNDTRVKLVNLLCDLAANGGELDMSPGMQKVELCYIDDIVTAVEVSALLVAESDESSSATYSVLTGDCYTLRELVNKVERVTGSSLNIRWGHKKYRQREVMEPPIQSYTKLPNWEPLITIDNGLQRIIASKLEEKKA